MSALSISTSFSKPTIWLHAIANPFVSPATDPIPLVAQIPTGFAPPDAPEMAADSTATEEAAEEGGEEEATEEAAEEQ